MNANDIASFGKYTITTLLEKRRGAIHCVAFCPICDQSEESDDEGRGQKNATFGAISKVRNHMNLRHLSAINPRQPV
jgi:hypothetical protein